MALRMSAHVPGNLERRRESIGNDASAGVHANISNFAFQASGGHLASERGVQVPAIGKAPALSHNDGQPCPAASVVDRPFPAAEFGKFSDLGLWQLFQKSGDERAFAELYQRHKDEIYTYCVRMMSGDRDKASDLFQEVFIRAFEKADQFRSGTNVGGWLYMIARNMCLNMHRNAHTLERLDGPDASLSMLASTDRSLAPEYDEEQHFLRRNLEEALAQLPLEFREPFMLREFDGFTYREIAAMTGTTLGMTKVRIYRAKKRMRELLAPAFLER